jgi:hypothetical protein
MKYIIIGGGPAGLSLAYTLASNDIGVEVIEKNEQLGGSWNSQWVETDYWSENAPRVLTYSDNTKRFLEEIGITTDDLGSIYGDYFRTNFKIVSFIAKYFTVTDYAIFTNAAVKYNIVDEPITMHEWLTNSDMSNLAKNAIRIICITICDIPKKTNVNDFFGSISAASAFTQFKQPNKWHHLIETKLASMPHVTIKKKTMVNKLLENNNKITGVVCKHLDTGMTETKTADKVVLCTQSDGILNVIENSNAAVQNNWKPFKEMALWCQTTFYSAFSFQLHFSETVEFPEEWCWSCESEWSIIILPISNWVTNFTKNLNVKTVWSCCIIDMETKSSVLNKTPNQCTKNEIVQECLRQIKKNANIPQPYHVTTSVGLEKKNGRWVSINTGFTRGEKDYLPMKGKIDNLFALGCFTKPTRASISYMETAITSVVGYLSTYEKTIRGFHKPTYNDDVVQMITFLLISGILANKLSLA